MLWISKNKLLSQSTEMYNIWAGTKHKPSLGSSLIILFIFFSFLGHSDVNIYRNEYRTTDTFDAFFIILFFLKYKHKAILAKLLTAGLRLAQAKR